MVHPASQPACLAAPDKNKARLMEFKWWYGGHCRLQNIHLQSVISKYWGVSTVKYPNIPEYLQYNDIGGYPISKNHILQNIYGQIHTYVATKDYTKPKQDKYRYGSCQHIQIYNILSALKYLNIALVVNVANNIYCAHMRLKFPVNLQGTKVHIFDSKNPFFVGLNHHSEYDLGLKSLQQGLLCSL